VHPADLLDLFVTAADAQRVALAPLSATELRARTPRPGQYALDLVADAAVLDVLHQAPVAVVSEESGRSGPAEAAITVVVDPVDGSTNCSRRIPYWGISLCALDGDGPLCALVVNTTTGEQFSAVRGDGAQVNGTRLRASTTTRVEDSFVAVSSLPRPQPWKQFRALGSGALALCDLAAGRVDAYFDSPGFEQAPWDYLGGLLACTEAGATVVDGQGRALAVTDPDARRQLLAAATPELLDALRAGMVA
jgi:myo-inositol-1(or 4)-monophosphatase